MSDFLAIADLCNNAQKRRSNAENEIAPQVISLYTSRRTPYESRVYERGI
ncbi:hypothetical protein [Ralstonia pseudosolanacearum]